MARADGSVRTRRSAAGFQTYLAPLLRATALTPRMLRLTVGGGSLRGFRAGLAADERVKLFFGEPGGEPPALPEIGPWGLRYPEGAVVPHARSYTVRRFDTDTGELDIDFVVHGDGRAARWALDARPGDVLGIAGPSGGHDLSPQADLHLLAGDESALPAIATMLERLPEGARAHAIVEVADADEEQQLPQGPGVSVQWVHRGPGPHAQDTPLERAVRELPWPGGLVHAWVAGEAGSVRRIRRHLREERGLGRTELTASGYWRQGMTVEQWVAVEDPNEL
ncbi:siderophore-interacting protein [Streptomyces gamaensis]|uniref:Siderophore-interacting protein n=1 Tax=Streptomyces gamaensis TaxID=1763542 RepID=A0ABW0Z2M7_9ACTN